jgi:hypothetical protein
LQSLQLWPCVPQVVSLGAWQTPAASQQPAEQTVLQGSGAAQ